MLQSIRLAGLVGSVYAAAPFRDAARPYVAGPTCRRCGPSCSTASSGGRRRSLCYVVTVGLASLAVKMARRRPFGEAEPNRTDQFAGFFLGGVKGAIVVAFLVAALQRHAVDRVKGIDWAEQQAKESYALQWDGQYHPADRIWTSVPVQHFVAEIRRKGLLTPDEASSRAAEKKPVQAASAAAPPRLDLERPKPSTPTPPTSPASSTAPSKNSRTATSTDSATRNLALTDRPRASPRLPPASSPEAGSAAAMSLTIAVPRWAPYALLFGLYLTARGYHSRDGDQAYRLPLLLHQQDPALFADDPFVRAFDAFNPHRGYLALLDLASRPLGLSAGLFALFALDVRPDLPRHLPAGPRGLARARARVGLVAVGLVLIAKAGNIGTNHLFEAMLLDRLIGFASAGWRLALAVEGGDAGGRRSWSGWRR